MKNPFRKEKEERNVEEKSKKEIVRVSRCTIRFLDGSTLSWTQKPYAGKGVIIWLNFYKMRRDQIRSFQITITEETE